jgi:hypothetical protein
MRPENPLEGEHLALEKSHVRSHTVPKVSAFQYGLT